MRPGCLCPSVSLLLVAFHLLVAESAAVLERESREARVTLCGTKLLDVVGKLCNNCVKITGPTNKIPLKRGGEEWPWHPVKRWSGGTSINACCLRGCSLSQLNQMCCRPSDPECSCSSK